MQYFSAKIRLAGSLLNEVWRDRLSVPEVMVLQALHGSDAVLDLKLVDEQPLEDHAAERERIGLTYGRSEASRPAVKSVLGTEWQPLPEVLPGFVPEAPAKAPAKTAKAKAKVEESTVLDEFT